MHQMFSLITGIKIVWLTYYKHIQRAQYVYQYKIS